MHLLLIEDEVGASDLLVDRLSGAGFLATRVQSTGEALSNINAARTAAVLIDQTQGTLPPAQVIRPLRHAGIRQPLLMLSPRDDWREKVAALDAGADDYAIKPIRSEEVAARLRAVIRRGSGQASDRIVMGDLDLDMKARCAWLGGRCLDLSRNEFRLLRTFMLAGNQPVLRRAISASLAANGAGMTANAVEVQVARLRRKVGSGLIRTIRGVGYQLVIEPAARTFAPIERKPCKVSRSGQSCCERESGCGGCQDCARCAP